MAELNRLISMTFGSHLYGTATPASDLDLKGVHLPSMEEILLQRVQDVISTTTKTDNAAKNTADDVDEESFALQKFLHMAGQGQTVVVDMLFAPDWAWRMEPSPIWLNILDQRPRLLTSQSASFVGYCRTQANKYGIRGSRVAAARAALHLLDLSTEAGRGQDKLSVHEGVIIEMCKIQEHMSVIEIPMPDGTKVQHWEVCNRKMPFTASIKSARDIMQRVVDEYGHRALAAEKNQGVDWKALSHAVRIARQAIELLSTGKVTFPRPEAEHLLAIKGGHVPYAKVAEEIDSLLIQVEAAAEGSWLPAKTDLDWAEGLVLRSHASVVITDYPF